MKTGEHVKCIGADQGTLEGGIIVGQTYAIKRVSYEGEKPFIKVYGLSGIFDSVFFEKVQ